ncbi:MAG: GNAT family N-acetyltransferase [Candidatus Atribacteria bacterium]|nr:MAG: GNAT family N-acetyltransferase [Candidatus Atribacteria bacterium]
MSVAIREITEANFVEAMRLEVAPEQKSFVASNAASIAQSKFHNFLECCGIYDEDVMIGFCAFGKNPDDGTAWIVRFMVGAQFQRKGYGASGLRALIAHMLETYDCTSIFLDVGPDNDAARKLYEGAGFVDTGEVRGKSMVYRLDLEPHDA